MAVTNRDIVKNALRLIGVLPSGTDPSAEDAEDAMTELNGLLSEMEAADTHIGWSAQTLDDAFLLDEKHERGFAAMLAMECAPLFGVEPMANVVRRASIGAQLITAAYHAPEPLRVDVALQIMPSQRRYY
jgi:hypothetical protein